MSEEILKNIDSYYSNKIIQYGATPKGVDWNSIESQELRFSVLSEVIEEKANFSILDFGCGYGSMFNYYKKSGYKKFLYTGFDISKKMIEEAEIKNSQNQNLIWCSNLDPNIEFDYVIASGIFNIKLEENDVTWLNYILETLNLINKMSIKGFSFNLLTIYSDAEYMKDYLYYADPLLLFDYCKKNFSKYVTLKHDYPLYEFSISVKK